MSKKQARSEREVDLPDWADDVTPADEVMRKFYAPTGAFKPGPIGVQVPASPDTHLGEEGEETVAEARVAPHSPSEPAPDASAAPSTNQTNVREEVDARAGDPLPPPTRATRRPPERKAVAPETSASVTTVQGTHSEPPTGGRATSFGEFSKRWSRYLYPGQLAVMRELYELTVARGTTDCFTRYSEIASATKMTRRNCINVMNSLVERGFVERLEVRNDAAGKGIRLRIHTEPRL